MSRLLCVSDLHGRLDSVAEIHALHTPDFIVHTGNFGFWDASTLDYESAYLKQIVAFSEVLPHKLVKDLNELSTIAGTVQTAGAKDAFRTLLADSPLSQLDAYLTGQKSLPCAVYTVFGPLDDPRIVSKFQSGQWSIPNLYLIDHNHSYLVRTPFSQPNVRLYGLGGNVKVHSLFDNGTLDLGTVSGKVGDLWVTLSQIAEMYLDLERNGENDHPGAKEPTHHHHAFPGAFGDSGSSSDGRKDGSTQNLDELAPTINIFVSHAPVVKTPLLEHLAIVTKADFTLSQGLHFRYPIMGNGMSLVDTMGGSAGYIENYRLKFLRLRMILGELWLLIRDDVLELLNDESPSMSQLLKVGLNLFDNIPVPVTDSIEKIVPLSLEDEINNAEGLLTNKKILAHINDHYFAAYYNLWHFNLCDHIIRDDDQNDKKDDYNVMLFKLDDLGNFRLEYCNSLGFNFNQRLRKQRHVDPEKESGPSRVEVEVSGEERVYERSPKSGAKKADSEGENESAADYSTTFESEETEDHANAASDDDFDRLAKTRDFLNLTNKLYRGRGKRGGRGRGRGGLRGRGRGRGRE